MSTTTEPTVSNSPLFQAYERAAADQAILDALRQVDLTFNIEHGDASCSPVWFGTAATEPAEQPTIRIVLASTTFAEDFWTGSEPLVLALVHRQLTIHGPVNRILELVGVLPLLFAALAR